MVEDYEGEQGELQERLEQAQAEAEGFKQRAKEAEGQLAELRGAEREGPTVEELDGMSMKEYAKYHKKRQEED